ERYEGAPVDGSAWTQNGECDWRVMRGGGWGESLKGITSARRWYGRVSPDAIVGAGFRVARALAQ
ncbi:formylglycine-generating enzyme family protein, partial [Rhodomicrobium vannielii ATCC 17100]|nr:formylglycine-generating enzyme family protein [Rhodomicrobium vannielii ATCC 17100]